MARACVGTSGWNYEHWSAGVFYPKGLKPSEWLRFYARHFDSVEVNSTFYRLPERPVFEAWHAATPRDFVFAVKASRFITHIKKLADPEEPVALLGERAAGLGRKLGVVLFQLPPFLRFNEQRLVGLLKTARRQEGLRGALEIRHPSWMTEACFQALKKHNVALAFADGPELPVSGPVTADFVFLRRHGPEARYASPYTETRLRADAEKIRAWLSGGKDVYIYFNNDFRAYAVQNALRLKELLGQVP